MNASVCCPSQPRYQGWQRVAGAASTRFQGVQPVDSLTSRPALAYRRISLGQSALTAKLAKMVRRIPALPAHTERMCWGCERYCAANDLRGGKGKERTQHP